MHSISRCSVAMFLSLLVFTSGAHAAPNIVEHHRYYDVEGHDSNAIRQSMNQQHRKHVRGSYDVYVSWLVL